jgi:transcriptional regulator with XRE-family HTH domain
MRSYSQWLNLHRLSRPAKETPVNVPLVIKHRLKELGLEQKDLAIAAEVTESYISQLLARKKAPPAPGRTDIYEKMGKCLRLPSGELSRLADLQRREDLKKKAAESPGPLFKDCRELILRKCEPGKQAEVREIFEKEPFGALERLVTQKLLDVAKRVAREELESENWLRLVARLAGRSYEQMRVLVLEFLDTDVFNVSAENWISFLDPLIESWDINVETFGVEIVLNRRLALDHLKRFEFVERKPEQPFDVEPGLEEFLKDPSLSSDAAGEEIEFLKRLRFKERRPTPLYYYRELQNLRDPLHFHIPAASPSRPSNSRKVAQAPQLAEPAPVPDPLDGSS